MTTQSTQSAAPVRRRRRVVALSTSPSRSSLPETKGSGTTIATISVKGKVTTSRMKYKTNFSRYSDALLLVVACFLVGIHLCKQYRESSNSNSNSKSDNDTDKPKPLDAFHHPRRVDFLLPLDSNEHHSSTTNKTIISQPKAIQIETKNLPTTRYELEDTDQTSDGSDDEDEDDEVKQWIRHLESDLLQTCEHKEDWMHPHNAPSTCHLLHEFFSLQTTESLQLINCGTSHCALSFGDYSSSKSIVMKITMLDKDALPQDEDKDEDEEDEEESHDLTEPQKYDQSWRETIALERLQHSPYILDIYANCHQSQLTEFARDGSVNGSISLLDWINILRTYPEYAQQVTPKTKLLVAYQLASAVSAVHHGSCGPDADDSSYCMAHNDLFVHQFLFIDGIFKLNDFNLSNHARVSKRTGEQCMDTISEMEAGADKSRSPEELLLYWGEHDEDDPESSELLERNKVDVWYLGQAIYHVLTLQWMFEELESIDDARDLIINGRMASIPRSLLQSEDPYIQALVEIIHECWTYDFTERPTSMQIQHDLKETLDELGIADEHFPRVTLPPIPSTYDHSEDDFNMALYGKLGLRDGWFTPKSEHLLDLSDELWEKHMHKHKPKHHHYRDINEDEGENEYHHEEEEDVRKTHLRRI